MFSRVAHLAYIWWKVPFDRMRAKQARHHHYQTLAITQTPHSGLFSPFHHTHVVETNLQIFRLQPDSVHTIQDALAHLAQPQPVQAGQSSSSEASQQVLLEALPPVLVLHLERFLHDAATEGINKISKPVQFGPELEISQGTIFSVLAKATGLRIVRGSVGPEIMAPLSGKSAEAVHYKLYGVLYHHGESAGSGNYTVSVLNPNGESGSGEAWLHIDNEAVSAVHHDDVFNGDDNERVDNQCAYMLFYSRMAPA